MESCYSPVASGRNEGRLLDNPSVSSGDKVANKTNIAQRPSCLNA